MLSTLAPCQRASQWVSIDRRADASYLFKSWMLAARADRDMATEWLLSSDYYAEKVWHSWPFCQSFREVMAVVCLEWSLVTGQNMREQQAKPVRLFTLQYQRRLWGHRHREFNSNHTSPQLFARFLVVAPWFCAGLGWKYICAASSANTYIQFLLFLIIKKWFNVAKKKPWTGNTKTRWIFAVCICKGD